MIYFAQYVQLGNNNDIKIHYLEGEQHRKQKLSNFVCYLKIINSILKNIVSILKQIVWEM